MIELKKFQRKKENFSCETCGLPNTSNGFTNHCSGCLWSKHVDINPGDRLELCQGMMEPASLFKKNGATFIVHQCILCKKSRNKKINDRELGRFLELKQGR